MNYNSKLWEVIKNIVAIKLLFQIEHEIKRRRGYLHDQDQQ